MFVRKAGWNIPSLSEITVQASPLHFCVVKPTARQDLQRDGFVHVQLFESIFCFLLSGQKKQAITGQKQTSCILLLLHCIFFLSTRNKRAIFDFSALCYNQSTAIKGVIGARQECNITVFFCLRQFQLGEGVKLNVLLCTIVSGIEEEGACMVCMGYVQCA